MTIVRLLDGREVDAVSEEWRHETEARMICNFRTLFERREYLAAVERMRGAEAAKRLRDTMAEIWHLSKKTTG